MKCLKELKVRNSLEKVRVVSKRGSRNYFVDVAVVERTKTTEIYKNYDFLIKGSLSLVAFC